MDAQRLERALVAADAAGDTEAATQLAGALRSLRSQSAPTPEKPGAWVRAGRGAQDVVDRLTQVSINAGEKLGLVAPGIGDLATQAMQDDREAFSKVKEQTMGDEFDLAGLVGNAGMQAPLALLPGGKAKLLSRAIAGAAQGGLSGALQFDESNSAMGSAKNALIGAGTGAIINPVAGFIGDKLGNAVKLILGRAKGLGARISGDAAEDAILKAVPELQDMTPEQRMPLLEEAKKQITKVGSLDEAALSRKANLVANEVTPTKSMVTRDPADWTLERNLQKLAQSPDEQLSTVGRELTDVYRGNDAAMTRQLEKMGTNIPKATQEGHGMTVMKAVDDLADETQQEVGKLYEAVRAQHGDKLTSGNKALLETIEDLKDNSYADKMVDSTIRKLRRLGAIDESGKPAAQLTVSQMEELRKAINKLPNDYGKRDLIAAIDKDVLGDVVPDLSVMTPKNPIQALEAEAQAKGFFTSDSPDAAVQKAENEWLARYNAAKKATPTGAATQSEPMPVAQQGADYFASARKAAKERFALLRNPATQKALNAYGELTQGKTAQNFIKSQVIDAPAQDVKTLVSTLGKIGDEAKKTEALNAMKGGVLSYLQSKAINPNSGQFSGAALNKAVNEIGDEKLALTLGNEGAKKLKSLARAALDATYQPPYAAVNNSNTAPMLMSLMEKGRYAQATPILGQSIEAAKRISAQNRAQRQIAEALAAQTGELPQVPQSMSRLADALRMASAPAAATAVNQQRKPADKKPKDRK